MLVKLTGNDKVFDSSSLWDRDKYVLPENTVSLAWMHCLEHLPATSAGQYTQQIADLA